MKEIEKTLLANELVYRHRYPFDEGYADGVAPERLVILAVLPREDLRDAFISLLH